MEIGIGNNGAGRNRLIAACDPGLTTPARTRGSAAPLRLAASGCTRRMPRPCSRWWSAMGRATPGSRCRTGRFFKRSVTLSIIDEFSGAPAVSAYSLCNSAVTYMSATARGRFCPTHSRLYSADPSNKACRLRISPSKQALGTSVTKAPIGNGYHFFRYLSDNLPT